MKVITSWKEKLVVVFFFPFTFFILTLTHLHYSGIVGIMVSCLHKPRTVVTILLSNKLHGKTSVFGICLLVDIHKNV